MPEISDLTPVTRVERILDGENLTPVNRLEYFLAKAAEGGGGGGGSVYSPVLAQTTKSVSSHWVSSFSGGPILEDANYRVIVNGTTYEPLTGTAGEDGYICLGNTYVDDSDPAGDYGFGIFYKNSQLSAWLETGDSMTMQIDQIIQAVPVPTPAAADTGKVLTANNGAVEWKPISTFMVETFYDDTDPNNPGFYLDASFNDIVSAIHAGKFIILKENSSEEGLESYAFSLVTSVYGPYTDPTAYEVTVATGPDIRIYSSSTADGRLFSPDE